MDAAVLVTMVVGFMATVIAVIGFNLQLAGKIERLDAKFDAKFDRLDAKLDRLTDRLEEHILDTGKHN